MPCTESKRNANRENAKKSTGPKTSAGKARSSRNALKHGFCAAASSLTPLEDRNAYATYTQRLIHGLHPRTAMEEDLAHRIADLSWRLRRIPDAEAALLARDTFTDLAHRCPQDEQREDREDRQDRDEPEDREEPEGAPIDHERNDDDAVLPDSPARLLAAAMSAPQNPYLTLQRYEQSLDRARSRALRELRQLQKDRRAHPHEDEAPAQIEPTSPTTALPPSHLEGEASGTGGCRRAGRGEGEAFECKSVPRRNEPTASSVSSVSTVVNPQPRELPNEPKPQAHRPPALFHLTRSDLRPVTGKTTTPSPAHTAPAAASRAGRPSRTPPPAHPTP